MPASAMTGMEELARAEAAIKTFNESIVFLKSLLDDQPEGLADQRRTTLVTRISQGMQGQLGGITSDLASIQSRMESAATDTEAKRAEAASHAQAKKDKLASVEKKEEKVDELLRVLRGRIEEADKKMEIAERKDKATDDKIKAAEEKAAAAVKAADHKMKAAEDKVAAALKAQNEARVREASLDEREKATKSIDQQLERLSSETEGLRKRTEDVASSEGRLAGDEAHLDEVKADMNQQRAEFEHLSAIKDEELKSRRIELDRREGELMTQRKLYDQFIRDGLEALNVDTVKLRSERETLLQEAAQVTLAGQGFLQQAIDNQSEAHRIHEETRAARQVVRQMLQAVNDREKSVEKLREEAGEIRAETQQHTIALQSGHESLLSARENIRKDAGARMQRLELRMKEAKEVMAELDSATVGTIQKLKTGSDSATEVFDRLARQFGTASLDASGDSRAEKRPISSSAHQSGQKRSRSVGATGALSSPSDPVLSQAQVVRPDVSRSSLIERPAIGPAIPRRGSSLFHRQSVDQGQSIALRPQTTIGAGLGPIASATQQQAGISGQPAPQTGVASGPIAPATQPQAGSSGQAAQPTTITSLDPPGLATVSSELRQIWSQIQFPTNWTLGDSEKLLTMFENAKSRPSGSSQRYWPQQGMDIISSKYYAKATSTYCLERYFRRQRPEWDENTDVSRTPCKACKNSSGLCMYVLHVTDDPPAYDILDASKRWRLVKRE